MELRDRLRAALRAAMRARDAAAVAALRSAIAAVDNAGAVDRPPAGPAAAGTAPGGTAAVGTAAIGSPDVAGALPGLGAGEVPRRALTEAEIVGLVRAEVTDRLAAAGGYERSGRGDRAARLRREAEVLTEVLTARTGSG